MCVCVAFEANLHIFAYIAHIHPDLQRDSQLFPPIKQLILLLSSLKDVLNQNLTVNVLELLGEKKDHKLNMPFKIQI